MHTPSLQRVARDGLVYWTDPRLSAEEGVLVAFSERTGGVSAEPFGSLNLAAHVGDIAECVDANRRKLLGVLGIGEIAGRLTTCEQVHGNRIADVLEEQAGSGALASSVVNDRTAHVQDQHVPPIIGCDALATTRPAVPLLLFFADCVPVVLVAPGPAIAVIHAGWRGALADLPGTGASHLASIAGVEASSIRAYIGAHIGPCHYEVSDEVLSLFTASFGNLARAESGGLDLGAVVTASLIRSGVDSCCIAALGTCTAESTECFYSYRAEGGLTGRHGALACILS